VVVVVNLSLLCCSKMAIDLYALRVTSIVTVCLCAVLFAALCAPKWKSSA